MVIEVWHGGVCRGKFTSWPLARAHAESIGGYTIPTDPLIAHNFPVRVRVDHLPGALKAWARHGICEVVVSLGEKDGWLAVDLHRCDEDY